jgi:4-hydroxybenzoate polyprenyltransferase
MSPLGVVQFSVAMFLAGFVVALLINHQAQGITVFCIVFLILYSSFFKRMLGFISNILIGLSIGTIPFFSEAAIF